MTDKPLPDWITIGATVAVNSSGMGRMTYTLHTVERLTKTRIVLANGQWFHRDTLKGPQGSGWSVTDRLADPSDPQVALSLLRQQCSTLHGRLDKAFQKMPDEVRRGAEHYEQIARLANRLGDRAQQVAQAYVDQEARRAQ